MIKLLTNELAMKIVKLKDEWVNNVITTHTSIDSIETFKSMTNDEVSKFLIDEGIELVDSNEKSIVYKGDEVVSEWNHKYQIEECEDGLKIKIESWIK